MTTANAPGAILSLAAYREAVGLRDLTDEGQGPHALQLLVRAATTALSEAWGVPCLVHRANPVIPIEDNYDRLGYPPEGVARDARYTRYVSERLLLRTQTSAMVPDALRRLELSEARSDWLLACPGMVYRRDEIDRQHCGEPHQLDLWRVRRGPELGSEELSQMIALLVSALLPGARYRTTAARHPYTLDGRQIDVELGGDWVEIGECGRTHPRVLRGAGLAVPPHSGLALGLGLDRILMLRKGIPDIRLLRSRDPRIAAQMRDLEPYRSVSAMPPVRRDLSLCVDAGCDAEVLGDRIRNALRDDACAIEELAILSETPYADLPAQAVLRMGMRPGQKNVLVRLVIRDYERTLTDREANRLRNRAYDAVHEGSRREVAADAG